MNKKTAIVAVIFTATALHAVDSKKRTPDYYDKPKPVVSLVDREATQAEIAELQKEVAKRRNEISTLETQNKKESVRAMESADEIASIDDFLRQLRTKRKSIYKQSRQLKDNRSRLKAALTYDQINNTITRLEQKRMLTDETYRRSRAFVEMAKRRIRVRQKQIAYYEKEIRMKNDSLAYTNAQLEKADDNIDDTQALLGRIEKKFPKPAPKKSIRH